VHAVRAGHVHGRVIGDVVQAVRNGYIRGHSIIYGVYGVSGRQVLRSTSSVGVCGVRPGPARTRQKRLVVLRVLGRHVFSQHWCYSLLSMHKRSIWFRRGGFVSRLWAWPIFGGWCILVCGVSEWKVYLYGRRRGMFGMPERQVPGYRWTGELCQLYSRHTRFGGR
jgi:hypothetical protein